MNKLLALSAAALLVSQAAVFAETKIEFKPQDTPVAILIRLVGQKVELHLKNGEKIGGKVESASLDGVHLSNLAGQEFFDAVVASSEISAVVVRTK